MKESLTHVELARGTMNISAGRWHAAIVRLLQGSGELESDDATTSLSFGDGGLTLVNAGISARLRLAKNARAAICYIDIRRLSRATGERPLRFFCDPTLKHQEGYHELAQRADDLLRANAEQGDFAQLHIESAELALARCLVDRFIVADAFAITQAERFQSYIDAHFEEPLTLAQVAQHFNFTPEAFARAFKRETGQTMLAYLTDVRLEEARTRLTSTNDTVTRIALDVGFPNVASFNRSFKRAEGTTPTAYRINLAQARKSDTPHTEQLGSLVEPSQPSDEAAAYRVRIDASAECSPARPWRHAIGLGTIDSLAHARTREQALLVMRSGAFDRGRIAFDPGDYLGAGGYERMRECFDFYLSQGIRSLLSLRLSTFGNDEESLAFLAETLHRFSNRYGIDTLREWSFELRCPSGIAPDSPRYAAQFSSVSAMLEHMGMAHGLVGPGIEIGYNAENIRAFARMVRRSKLSLGGVSVASRPALPTAAQAGSAAPTTDPLFMRNQLLLARAALAEEDIDPELVQVGGWTNARGIRNILCDSSYEGASIVRSLLASRNLASGICYDWALDSLSPADLGTSALFDGKPGLLMREGIPKPSYHAFEFLSHITDRIVYADERCIASLNATGNLQLVAHNCETLGAGYLTTPEEQLAWQDIPSYFDRPSERTLQVTVHNARPGTYLVKTRTVSAEEGSVADAAARMRLWCVDEPNRSEIEYLAARANPRLGLEVVLTQGDTLSFQHTMASNEIVYIHMIYLY